jgi:hypothetical protein
MESLETQRRIINLGKALVEELGLNPGVDTLSRWMAHYIAEQIDATNNVSSEDKAKVEQRCFESILKLWQHRSSYHSTRRPFESFQPIFHVLEKLDPENRHPHYFINYNEEDAELTKVPEGVKQWLEVAEGIDNVARVWIQYVLKQAALSATDDKTIEWLNNSVGLGDVEDFTVILRLLPDDILFSDEEEISDCVVQKKRDMIQARIKKLETFSELNQKLLSIFQQELSELSDGD